MAMKSTDYDERIERAKAQLRKWQAEKKKLATKEAKAAQREAEAKRDAELRQKGYEFEDIENWMQSRTITIDGAKMTLEQKSGSWRIVVPFPSPADPAPVAQLIDMLTLAPICDMRTEDELNQLHETLADFGLNPPRSTISLSVRCLPPIILRMTMPSSVV